MYIKRLEIENFKNFRGRIVFHFKKGFNGIAGPNGSGKSNITDAIVFVFGPRSAIKLRASRLADLVWSGDENSEPAKECVVSIVFDNTKRELKLNADEVKFTRRIKVRDYKDGSVYSYFYINGKLTQQSYFYELLSRVNLSSEGYNIIQQGHIGNILSKTKIERRKIIDDVAGVARYDREIEKAIQRQQRVEENIKHTSLVMEERMNQLHELKEEREVALKYRELTTTKKYLEWQYLNRKYRNLHRKFEYNKNMISKLNQDIFKAKEKLTQYRENKTVIEKRIHDIMQRIEDAMSKEEQELNAQRNALIQKLVQVKAALESNMNELENQRTIIKDRSKLLKKAKKEYSSTKKALDEISKELNAKKSVFEKVTARILELKEATTYSNKEIQKLQNEISKLNEEMNKKIRTCDLKKLELENISKKINEIKEEIAALEIDEKNARTEYEDAKWRLNNLKESLRDVDKKIKDLKTKYDELLDLETLLESKKGSLYDRILTLNKEYNALMREKSAASMAGERARVIDMILEAKAKNELRGILGTVAQLIEVKDEYKTAIAIAGGSRLNAIVVEDIECAQEAIKFIKKNKLGRIAFLPLDKMVRGMPRGKSHLAVKDPNAIGFASDLVKYDERIAPVLWHVFADTVVMKDFESAKKYIGGVRIVTLDGTLFEPTGAIVGGSINPQIKRIEFGRQHNEKLKHLEKELKDLQSEYDSIIKKLPDIKNQRLSIERELLDLKEQSRVNEGERYKMIMDQTSKNLKDLMTKIESKKKVIEEQNVRARDITNEITALEKEIEQINTEIDLRKKKINELLPDKISREIEELDTRKNDIQTEIQSLQERKIELEKTIEYLNEKIEEYGNDIKKSEIVITKCENEIKIQQRKCSVLDEARREIEDKIAKMNEKVKTLRSDMDSLKDELHRLDTAIQETNREINTTEQKKVELQGILEEISKQISSVQEQIITLEKSMLEKGIDMGEDRRNELLRNLPAESELEARIKKINDEIEGLGEVNQTAIEKYDRLLRQVEELRDKLRSFEEEKNEWIKVEKTLREKKYDVFMHIFKIINENFSKIFGNIIEGGQANLVLENPRDPFEGGLDIEVKLPGQKSTFFRRLSRGEQSLTALALIFAIQHYIPSPIYIFDEVDENLDSINSEKVSMMIKRSSEVSQFIVISHHKVMLKEAEMIYGVTKRRKDGAAEVYALDVSQLMAEEEWDSTNIEAQGEVM